MNREQKAAAVAEIAANIDEAQAIFAVDYRGISVVQIAELRAKLRDADATFKVVKNSLTELAADTAGAEALKGYLEGPTALTFVRGDAATAAKAIADYARATQLLPFKGGIMDRATLEVEQIRSLSRLPSREVLYGQLVGVVASPVSGLVRTLNALLGGLAVALGQVRDKKQTGELPAGEKPAAEAATAEEPAGEEPAVDAPAEQAADEEQAEDETAQEEPAAAAQKEAAEDANGEGDDAPAKGEAEEALATGEAGEASGAEEAEAGAGEEAAETAASGKQTEPDAEPEHTDDNQAGASAESQSGTADANPTKED
jgi:large subunit ribosomal protein L10